MKIKIFKDYVGFIEGDFGVLLEEGKREFFIRFAEEDYRDLSREEYAKNIIEVFNTIFQLLEEDTWKYKIITKPLGILRIYLEDLRDKIVANKN